MFIKNKCLLKKNRLLKLKQEEVIWKNRFYKTKSIPSTFLNPSSKVNNFNPCMSDK